MHPTRSFLPVLLALAACTPRVVGPGAPEPSPPAPAPAAGLPPVPEVDGALNIRVVHPTPSTPLPRVDSTFVFGSVGTGRASLTINGAPVPVAPNGAFLGWVAVPRDGVYRLSASAHGRRADATAAYRLPSPAAMTPSRGPITETFARPVVAVVSGGSDTLATGSDAAAGAPTLSGDRVWQLPRGARLAATARRGSKVRVELAPGTTGWFDASDLTLGGAAASVPTNIGAVRIEPARGWVDVRIPAAFASFRLDAGRDTLAVLLYRRRADEGVPRLGDPLFAGGAWRSDPAGARLELRLAEPLWGFKAFYSPGGDLVLRVRRPPPLRRDHPLRGLRIAVDPGHPPLGARGPTGLAEADANLAIALRLAERLRDAGATPILTRSGRYPVELGERPRIAVAADADLLVSVHNNAFPEGINPLRSGGTETYYFYPFAAELAQALDREIVAVARTRDLGAKRRSLALARPTWMPAVLTESLFMMVPEQEAALLDPGFVDRLAAAHQRGIEAFVRARAREQ